MPYYILKSTNTTTPTGRPIIMEPGTAFTPRTENNDFTGTSPQAFISYPNNSLAFDQNRLGGSGTKHRPRGSYRILSIYSMSADGSVK